MWGVRAAFPFPRAYPVPFDGASRDRGCFFVCAPLARLASLRRSFPRALNPAVSAALCQLLIIPKGVGAISPFVPSRRRRSPSLLTAGYLPITAFTGGSR